MINKIWNNFIERLIYEGDKKDPGLYRKGRFFVISILLFFVLGTIALPYYFSSSVQMSFGIKLANVLSWLILVAILVIYPRMGYRVILINLYFVAASITSTYTMYSASGGIYSPDNIFSVVVGIYIFLVANRLSGYIWAVVGILGLIVFYYLDIAGVHNFKADENKMTADYFLFSYAFSIVFATFLIILHENSKDKFLKELNISKAEIEKKSAELESQKEGILASIQYAKRIQKAVLPNEESLYRTIPLSFILFKPRDIVSGDFFWFHEIDRDSYLVACADCTGHGVPGALMTVIGSNALGQIVTEEKMNRPSEILFRLDKKISQTLKQEKARTAFVQDGMDMSIIQVNKSKKEFVFAGAKRPVIYISDQGIKELKGSKYSIGGMGKEEKIFEETIVKYEEDDMIYLFSDGYTDQFGGRPEKKFMIRNFRELLLKINLLAMNEQKQKLEDTITAWMDGNEQTDDIQVIGIRL